MIEEVLTAGANIESTDPLCSLPEHKRFGMTPLHIAVSEGIYPIIKYLLEKGADINARCNEGRSAVHIVPLPKTVPCVKNDADYWKIVKLLVKTALINDSQSSLSILDIHHRNIKP